MTGNTSDAGEASGTVEIVDLGRIAYGPGYEAQQSHHAEVLGWRDEVAAAEGRAVSRPLGRVLIVEHDPVITISRRPGVANHLLASPELLASRGIATHETDRGGDITYHGPGQVVLYPVVDLKRAGIRVVEYVRLLEQAVIDTIAGYGITGERDDDATGVWVPSALGAHGADGGGQASKVCAIGVRVRKWVTLHGLALNVRTDLTHFQTIVPCGLAGRPVTSLETLLGDRCPEFGEVALAVAARIGELLVDAG